MEVHKYHLPQPCSFRNADSAHGKLVTAIPLTAFLIHESQCSGHWLHNPSPFQFSGSFYYWPQYSWDFNCILGRSPAILFQVIRSWITLSQSGWTVVVSQSVLAGTTAPGFGEVSGGHRLQVLPSLSMDGFSILGFGECCEENSRFNS